MEKEYQIGDFAHGGIIAWINEDGTSGLVCSVYSLDSKFDWDSSQKACSGLDIGRYNDWRLPSISELMIIYENLHKNKLGGFDNISCWSCSERTNRYSYYFSFKKTEQECIHSGDVSTYYHGDMGSSGKSAKLSIRAVRDFVKFGIANYRP